MARNTYGTRSELIHCDDCGEEYSATYKRCPFCGARPDKGRGDFTERLGFTSRWMSEPDEEQPRSRSRASAPEEDDYVFDGQDVFDDEEDTYAGRRGGKHLAMDGLAISPTTIAGIIFSLLIIIAAIVIVVKVVVPMVQGGRTPTAQNDPNTSLDGVSASPNPSDSTDPNPANTDGTFVNPEDPNPGGVVPGDPSAVGNNPEDPNNVGIGDPNTSVPPDDPGAVTSPSAAPSSSTPPSTGSFTLSRSDITISDRYPNPVQLQANGASGTVTWSSSNAAVAAVNAAGVVSAVSRGQATITATDGSGRTQTCRVIVSISGTPVQPSSEQPSSAQPSAGQSETPAPSPSQSQAAAGNMTLSSTDITISNQYPTPITLRANGASGDVTWSTSNAAVATVDGNGLVTRVGAGKCTITATDSSGQTASCIVRCG